MVQRIYLDHNASTQLDPAVIKAITQELEEEAGNPSSIHYNGQKSKQRLEHARQRVAHFLQVKPHEIIFTSGGTEGASLLHFGIFGGDYSGHIITSNAEHSCVLNTVKELEKRGCEVTYLPAGLWGAVHPEAVREAIRPHTKLITLMAVNNVTGVKTDVEAIAGLAQERNIPFIVDGVALLGKENVKIPAGVSAMFFSAHKLHGPKGVGAVYGRSSLKLHPVLLGGHQEQNRRAGTENLPGIIGFATALDLLQGDQQLQFTTHMKNLRDRLEDGVKKGLPDVTINGQGPRIVNTSNLYFPGTDGESLLMALDMEGICVSHGSACTSGAIEPSRILLNMGVPLGQARSSIRFSISRSTTEAEIDLAIDVIVDTVKKLKSFKKSF